jgi:hypothetical protein
MSESVFQQVADRYPRNDAIELQLKGKSQPVRARIVDFAIPPKPAKLST